MPRFWPTTAFSSPRRNRVTERDLGGKVLWKLEGIAPVGIQRLPSGNTFIPCNGQIIEVDRAGKEVLRAPVAGIAAARRLPDGRIIAFDRNEIIQLDKAGKEVKRVAVMCWRSWLQRGAGQRPCSGIVPGHGKFDRV